MLAQIAPHVPAFSVVLLVVCGILIGVALTAWHSGDSTELEYKLRSLREEQVELQAALRQQQEINRQHEEQLRTDSLESAPLREMSARLELFLRHRQSEQGSIEDGLRTLQQLVQATHHDLRAEREQRGLVASQLETAQAELLVCQQELAAATDEKERLLNEKLPRMAEENQRLHEELTTSRQARERMAEERDAAVAALEEAGQAYVELQRDVDSHRRAIDSMERQRGQSQCELQALQQQVIDLRDKARGQQELVARYDAAQQELTEIRRRDAILRAQLAEALEAQRRWQLELQTGTAAAAADRQRLEQLEQRVASAEQQTDRIRSDRESTLESLRGAQAQNRDLTQQLGDQERLIRELRDEVDMLRSLLEQRAASPRIAVPPLTISDEPNQEAAARVAELERQVEALREQLRMAQVQAHELIQRQPTGSDHGQGDATVRHLQQQVHQQSRAITQLERDRQELLARIQRQNQLLEERAA